MPAFEVDISKDSPADRGLGKGGHIEVVVSGGSGDGWPCSHSRFLGGSINTAGSSGRM